MSDLMRDSKRITPPDTPVRNEGGTHHPSAEDLVLFAMQLLSAAQSDAVEQHVRHCSVCLEELGRIHGDLTAVALTAEAATPVPAARERLLAQVGREKKIVATPAPQTQPGAKTQTQLAASIQAEARERLLTQPEPSRPLARFGRNTESIPVAPVSIAARRPVLQLWAGWAAAAALAVVSGLLYMNQRKLQDTAAAQSSEIGRLNTLAQGSHRLVDSLTDPQAVRVMLTPRSTPHAPVAGVTYNAAKGTLVLLASNLDPLRIYKTYELWILPVNGAPVPAGTFHPDEHGNASVILPNLPKAVKAKAFAVTIEDAGGADKPTMPVIMAGS